MIGKGLVVLVISLFICFALAPSVNAVKDPIPDLYCYGDIQWTYPPIGETVIGTITVENVGESGSLLNWEIVSWPSFGVWTFNPNSGINLSAGDFCTVEIQILVTGGEALGCILIINNDDPDDFCEVDISIGGFPPPPKKIFGFIDTLNISEYFISFHIKLAIMISSDYSFPLPLIKIVFNKDFFNSKNYEGDIKDNFVWATFYY